MIASFSRLAVPQIRPRSLSPVSELNNGNKRQAVICDFFAKGWCIKGNSCRFLHIKDYANVTSQKSEDVAALDEKIELQADGGSSFFLVECRCPRISSDVMILISTFFFIRCTRW